MYIYLKFEDDKKFKVGIFVENGNKKQFFEESAFDTAEESALRCNFLNGGRVTSEIIETLQKEITELRESLADYYKELQELRDLVIPPVS